MAFDNYILLPLMITYLYMDLRGLTRLTMYGILV